METEEPDMSPEAITNRLKTMEQLWELSINLMNAKLLEKEFSNAAAIDEKSAFHESNFLTNNNLPQF